jgi:cell division protein FtsQ
VAVTVPADRRFRRRGSRPLRYARLRITWWRVLRSTVALAVLAYVGYRAGQYLMSASQLDVQYVVVEGNRRLSLGEATALLDGLKGENLLTADLRQWRERLMASSWVADAELRRRFPGTVVVRVTEREPIGIARLRDELFLVDGEGGIIDEFGPRYADCDLPIIDGLLVAGTGGSRVDETRGKLVAAMLADVRRRPDVARRVSQIDVSDAADLRVILDDDPTLLRLGDTKFLDRIWAYVGLAAELRQRVPGIRYVDLRVDNRWSAGVAAELLAKNTAPVGRAGGAAAAGQR